MFCFWKINSLCVIDKIQNMELLSNNRGGPRYAISVESVREVLHQRNGHYCRNLRRLPLFRNNVGNTKTDRQVIKSHVPYCGIPAASKTSPMGMGHVLMWGEETSVGLDDVAEVAARMAQDMKFSPLHRAMAGLAKHAIYPTLSQIFAVGYFRLIMPSSIEESHKAEEIQVSWRSNGFVWVVVERLQYFFSTVIILCSMALVAYGIVMDYNVAKFGGPGLEISIFFGALLLLASNEGFQVGILNTQHLKPAFIRSEGYPRAAKVHEMMFGTEAKPIEGNVKRLLIGQSFLVVLCSFTLAQLTTFSHMPNFMNINESAFTCFCRSGLPGIVLVITFAQLTPSLLAKEYPLRFLQIPGVYSTIYLALLLENCGVVHFTYVLFGILNRVFFQGDAARAALLVAGVPKSDDIISDASTNSSNADAISIGGGIPPGVAASVAPVGQALQGGGSLEKDLEYKEEEEDPESACEAAVEGVTKTARLVDSVLLYVRYVLSTVLTILCIVFVIGCIAKKHSMIQFAPAGQFVVFAVAMVIITYCEGMKVAVVSTTHLDSESLRTYPIAYKIHKLLNVDKTEGVKKFLLGRQLTVVPLGFLIAQLTHFENLNPDNFPNGLYFIVVVAGIPGVLILLQCAQLTPQLLAQQNSIPFLNLPGGYLLVLWTLALESLGLVNFTWIAYFYVDRALCHKRKDGEVYSRTSTVNPLFCILDEDDDIADAAL